MDLGCAPSCLDTAVWQLDMQSYEGERGGESISLFAANPLAVFCLFCGGDGHGCWAAAVTAAFESPSALRPALPPPAFTARRPLDSAVTWGNACHRANSRLPKPLLAPTFARSLPHINCFSPSPSSKPRPSYHRSTQRYLYAPHQRLSPFPPLTFLSG